MAVFFHDIIYNARSGTNEEDSAASYRQFETDLWNATTNNKAVCSTEDYDCECVDGTAAPSSSGRRTVRWNRASDNIERFILATKSHMVDEEEEDGGDNDHQRADRIRTDLFQFWGNVPMRTIIMWR